MMIEILDTNGANIPVPRTFAAKGDRPARTVYEQKAYLHKGGVFPEEFLITHNDPNEAYPVGRYQLSGPSFKINQYKQLELDRFKIALTPLSAELKKVG